MNPVLKPLRPTYFDFTMVSKPLMFFCRLLTIFQINILPCESVNGTAVSVGTCFAQRLSNGKCIRVLTGISTRQNCCESNGYFLNRVLSEDEYLRDHFLLEKGTSNCFQACNEMYRPTCEEYTCPEGHECRINNGEPRCICQPNCTLSDYDSGMVCTTNLRQFKNRCQLKKALCESSIYGYAEIACPQNQVKCAPDSVLTDVFKRSTDLLLRANELSRDVKDPFRVKKWFINKRGTFQMERLQRRRETKGENQKREEELIDHSIGLQCTKGEYCMLRQINALPVCVPWTKETNYRDCLVDETTNGPLCAVDNKTYVDRCELRYAGLRRQMEMRIAYLGGCRGDATCNNIQCPRPGMSCRLHHRTRQPVCIDCSHLPEDCNVSYQRHTNEPQKRVEGDPMWTPEMNTKGWPNVCGSNGRIYTNACFLHVVNCLTNAFVDLQHSNMCVDSF